MWPFPPRRDPAVAELRDRLIEAETACVFLANELEHARRPKREVRRDSGKFESAFEAMTAKLQAEVGRG